MNLQTSLEVVEQNAGDAWNAAALDAIRRVAEQRAELHAEDVIALFPDSPPNDRRAWGPVWMRAVKAGYVEKTDVYKKSSDLSYQFRPRAHPGHFMRVYKSLICS